MFLFTLFTITISLVSAKNCPAPPVQQNFNIPNYIGTWYEIQRFEIKSEDGRKCSTAHYAVIDASTISVNNTGYSIKTGEFQQIQGNAKVANQNEPAKLLLSLNVFGPIQAHGNYWVIDTDYSTYSLVYACSATLGLFETEYAWILSRQSTLDQKIIDNLKNKFNSYGIDSSQFKPCDQTCGKN